jgi:hypothetical protein
MLATATARVCRINLASASDRARPAWAQVAYRRWNADSGALNAVRIEDEHLAIGVADIDPEQKNFAHALAPEKLIRWQIRSVSARNLHSGRRTTT